LVYVNPRPSAPSHWHALRVAAWQAALAAVAAAAIALVGGFAAGAAALLGGAIAGAGSLAYALSLRGSEQRPEPKRLLRAHVRGEALKLAVSIAGLAIALGYIATQAALPLVGGFVVAIHGYFAALWFDHC
jgi:F0F1-type ATP synthase assembly protein I